MVDVGAGVATMKGCAGCHKALPFNGGTLIREREYCRRCAGKVREAARVERQTLELLGQQSIGGLVELPTEELEQASLFG